jgi:hypothetical protein
MILRDLPVGTKVKERKSSLVFLVADHNHMGYAGTALVTDCAIKLASFDASEPANPEESKKESGNNFYPFSNIHQWLNAGQDDWYVPAHDFDAPPAAENIDHGRLDFYNVPFYSNHAKFSGDFSYQHHPGFLTWFSPEFVESVCEVDVPCVPDRDHAHVVHGQPSSCYIKSKVFLLSAAELGFEEAQTMQEGFRFSLFNDGRMRVVAPTPAAIGRPSDYVYDDCSIYYWLRTPAPGTTNACYIYDSDHRVIDFKGTPLSTRTPSGLTYVNSVCGIRPALNLDPGVTVTNEPDVDGIYTLLYPGGIYG